MLGVQANAVSAAHCQEGQQQKVYNLKQIEVPMQRQSAGRIKSRRRRTHLRKKDKKQKTKRKNNIKRDY
jgi:hypothetical protein